MLAVPAFVGSALDPLVGAFGDTPRRRALVIAGGLAFALSSALAAGAVGFGTLLVALVIGHPASGAFVSLAQATLMDCAPERREHNMARWTLVGSFGYVGGPVLLAGALWAGIGWRGASAVLAVATLPLVAAARSLPTPQVDGEASPVENLRHALVALRRWEVARWLTLLECADLLLDVFHGFLALYLVDVAGATPATAALGVGVWTAAGLAGDWLLLVVLRRMSGLRYLRTTAMLAVVAYSAFLFVPGVVAKLALAASSRPAQLGLVRDPASATVRRSSRAERRRDRRRRVRRLRGRRSHARPRPRRGRGGARSDDVGLAARARCASGACAARAATLDPCMRSGHRQHAARGRCESPGCARCS